MASEDDTKTPPKPFPWWTVLISVIGVAIIVGIIFVVRRRRMASATLAPMVAPVGPNVAPPPGVMGARLNSSIAPAANAAAKI